MTDKSLNPEFAICLAALVRALHGIHGIADGLALPASIFQEIDQLVSDAMNRKDLSRPHLELIRDVVRVGQHSHPKATLDDATEELAYMSKLMKLSQRDGK